MPSFEDMLKPGTAAQPQPAPLVPPAPVASTAFDQMLQSNPVRPSAAPPSYQPTASAATSALEPCQPIVRPDTSSVWALAESEMNRIHAAVTAACTAIGIDAYIGQNNSFEFSYSVLFQAWLPLDNDPFLTDRVQATFTLEPKPSHKYPIQYTVKILKFSKKKEEKVLGIYGGFSDASVATLINYLVRGGDEPTFPEEIAQVHHNFFQKLSKVKNKVEGIKVDYWAASFLWLLAGAGVGAFVFWSIDPTTAFGCAAVAFVALIVLIMLNKDRPSSAAPAVPISNRARCASTIPGRSS